MIDTVDKRTRSYIMSRVRGKDTSPELALRKALFAKGLRYRLHVAALPGKPDIVFPSKKAVVFVHGCQWHWHGCPRSRMPLSNRSYWKAKIARNQERDREHADALKSKGWRVLIVWECALKPSALNVTADRVAKWVLLGQEDAGVIEPIQSPRTATL